MLLTASFKLIPTPDQKESLIILRREYGKACNLLVPIVQEYRLWNRVGLHQKSYNFLRDMTVLGSQMCCNAIFSVCKAYKSQNELGKIKKDKDVPSINFKRVSVHFDKRTYSFKKDALSLYTLNGRTKINFILGGHQRKLLAQGQAKEAELIYRNKNWYFNIVVEVKEQENKSEGPIMGIDVGENNLAAHSFGKVYGGENLRDRRDRYISLRRRLQSNGSQSARQKLRQVSGKENRRVKHINHVTSQVIVKEAIKEGVSKITMENLTHIRERIKAKKRIRARLHRWAWRQLQTFVEYKAKLAGIRVEYVNPAYTSQTCSVCGQLGKRQRHRFICEHCGLRAHSDLNASRNLARIGGGAPLPRAAVNTPIVGSDSLVNHGFALQ